MLVLIPWEALNSNGRHGSRTGTGNCDSGGCFSASLRVKEIGSESFSRLVET